MTKSPQILKNWIPVIRDLLLLLGGLGIALHETLSTMGERPSLLVLAATMMGLPIVLRKDQGDAFTKDSDGVQRNEKVEDNK